MNDDAKHQHVIHREKGGSGLESWIKPVCSCGWEGRREYAHNDWQMTNLAGQERDHLFVAGVGK